ncbi:MAG: MerC domain-containing protein [Asticcacaulis sp.]
MVRIKKKWLDVASIVLSAICVVHCIALPFLVVALPFLTPFTGSWVHAALVMMAAPMSFWAISASGAWRRGFVSVPICIGLSLLALAAFVPALADIEVAMSVAGALFIAFAHGYNYLYHRKAHVHSAACGHIEADVQGVAGD